MSISQQIFKFHQQLVCLLGLGLGLGFSLPCNSFHTYADRQMETGSLQKSNVSQWGNKQGINTSTLEYFSTQSSTQQNQCSINNSNIKFETNQRSQNDKYRMPAAQQVTSQVEPDQPYASSSRKIIKPAG